MKRRSCVALGAALIAAGVAFWLVHIDPFQRHQEFCRSTRAHLETLAKKRPPNLTRKQWNNVVGWTLNGHVNSLVAQQPVLGMRRGIPAKEMRRFEAELRDRLAGQVDLATIDWIWDEFERLAPNNGPEYSRKYRPTSPEKLREFEESNFTWGIDVD